MQRLSKVHAAHAGMVSIPESSRSSFVNDDEDGFDDDEVDYDDHPDLPPEAGQDTPKGYEPNDEWLKAADRRLQHEAMRLWFTTRYCDPSHNTPYNGEEGGYLYIHGGPYTAEDALYGRFSKVVDDPDKYIRRVIDDVEQDGIDEWVLIHHDREDEYDDRFDLEIAFENEPLQKLRLRIQQAREVLTLQGAAGAQRLAQQLVFASIISIVEAYLYEVAYYWIDHDEEVLRNVVTNLPAYQQEQITLSSLFSELKGLKAKVKGRLQSMVWHRWDQVAQLYFAALRVRTPSFKALNAALQKRHDIVHRNGHDMEGKAVTITLAEIDQLIAAVDEFATELDTKIKARSTDMNPGGIDAASADAPAPPLLTPKPAS